MSVVRKRGILAKIVKDTQQRINPAPESCAWQLCGGNFVALFVSTDHKEQKAICIVSYLAYYHSYPAARISESMTSLGFSLESVVLALRGTCLTRSASRLILRRVYPVYLLSPYSFV